MLWLRCVTPYSNSKAWPIHIPEHVWLLATNVVDFPWPITPEILGTFSLFNGLQREELQSLSALMHHSCLSPRADLFSIGAECGLIYLILKGTIKLWSQGPMGAGVIHRIAQNGAVVGRVTFLPDLGQPYSATALEISHVLTIESRCLHELWLSCPKLNENLLRHLAEMDSATCTRLHQLGTQNVRGRLAQQLLQLSKICDRNCACSGHDPGLIPLHLSQKDLAQLAGASPQHTNSVMTSFRREGLISVDDKQQIRVCDSQRLRRCISE